MSAPTPDATPDAAPNVVPPNASAQVLDTGNDTDQKRLDALAAEVEKWKALAQKHEQRAKGNASALSERDGLVSERDQLAERLTALEKVATDAEAKALRLTVATDKGVPVHMLHGTTEEELSAEADELIEFRGVQAPPRSATPQEAAAGNQGNKAAARGPADEFAAYITQQLRRS